MSIVAACCLLAFASSAQAAQPKAIGLGCNHAVSAKAGVAHAVEVWSPSRWKRLDGPKAAAVKAHRRNVRCAKGPRHRAAIRDRWRVKRAQFKARQRRQLKRHNVNYAWPGAVYPDSAWFGLPQLPPYVAAALAEAAGDYTGTDMPGWTMVQVSLGEGVLRPGSRSTDDGWGWLAITRPYGDNLGVPEMGGYEQMLNPVKNAYVAAQFWGASSSHFGAGGTWHGSSHVTDPDAHYRGRFDLRLVLGGESFKRALR